MFIEKLRGNVYLGGGEDEKRPALPLNGRSFSNNILPEGLICESRTVL
jgi:hypothetical protein